MTIFLTVAAIAAAIYLFAALAFYYGFKNWYPLCGGSSSRCGRGESCQNSSPASRNINSLQ